MTSVAIPQIPTWERVKRTDETATYSMNFRNWLPSDGTVTISTSTWTATDQSGADATSTVITSVADLTDDPEVKHNLTGGVSGTTYNIFATTTTSDGQTLVGHVKLVVQDAT